VGMLLFYVLTIYYPVPVNHLLTILFGIMEIFSIFLFFYNMLATLLPKEAR